jgi:hypothetical protein
VKTPPIGEVLTVQASATVLEAETKQRNWSREDLRVQLMRTARAMGERQFTVSVRQLDRWLAGEAGTPRSAACRVLERLFGRPVAIPLGSPVPAGGRREDIPVPDRTTVVDRLTTRAAIGARDHARAHAVAAVDAVSIEALHLEMRRLTRGYATTPPSELLAELVSARDRAYVLIDRTRRPADLADLYLIAGQACGLAATTAWDLGDPDAADDLANAAWTYGQLCGHNTLRAWTRSVQATIAFWSGRPGEGLQFAGDGLRYAEGAAAVRLYAIAARAWSLLPGGTDEARASLRQATEARDRDHGRDEMSDSLGGEFGFPPARLALCAGAVHIGLHDGASAARCAVDALQLYEQTPADQRRWAVRHGALMDLATARAQQGEVDGAADALRPALVLEPARRTARLTRRLQTLRAVVNRGTHRTSPVARDLVEAIDDWSGLALTAARPLALPPGR